MANDNTQTAPVSSDNASAAVQAPNAAGSTDAAQNSTDNADGQSKPAFDPQTSYGDLKSQYETINKSYAELRREFTRRSQYEAELKKQIEGLSKAFATATQKEISPEEFMKSLQTQGVKAFEPLREQWTKELNDNHNKALEELRNDNTTLKTNFEVMRRQLDSKNYPDFVELMPVMNEIGASENCPVDWGNPDIGLIYDTLYKLARNFKAEESVRKAHGLGLKQGEAQAAKEASTAVATGGKAGSLSNPAEIKDLKKLREYFVSQLGEAE